MMIIAFHMVSAISILLSILFLNTSQALLRNAVGRFPFLMPNVHPYRVSVIHLFIDSVVALKSFICI